VKYRAEIDGLRALAVVSVILYHAQMVLFGRDWFEGGFIGVDIFFVISGYLITRIILSELETKGSFSFMNFYERRARRILPMLFVVIFVSIPFAWEKLLPSNFVEYAESILASLFFGSNFFFYFSTTEYGTDSALLKPFLHTWSLGVEEQFYLVFPILAIVAYKYFRKHFLAILVVLSLISLLFAELMEVRNDDLNFYLPFSRFWELAVGSMLAYREMYYKPSNENLASKSLPMLGLYLIAYSILFFDGKTPHPSFHTLIPIIGVALIIGFASKDELVGKVLGSKPFVWIGLISYSAYLWHFPLFSFGRLDGEFRRREALLLILLTFILSFLSYRYIERIFRSSTKINKTKFSVSILVLTLIVSSFSFLSIGTNGFESRFTKSQLETINQFSKREFIALNHPLGKLGKDFKSGEDKLNCRMREPTSACSFGNEHLVFLGDSYVGHYERAFINIFEEYDFGYVSFNYDQCPFVSDQIWFGNVAECVIVNRQRRAIIKDYSDPKIFIISANYDQFDRAKEIVSDPISIGRKNLIDGAPIDRSVAWGSFFENIEWLLSLGHKVVLIRSLPMPNINSQGWLMSHKEYIDDQSYPNIVNSSLRSAVQKLDLEKFPAFQNRNLLIIDPSDALCDQQTDQCFDVIDGLGPIYNGGRHLSFFGSDLVGKLVEKEMLRLGWILQ